MYATNRTAGTISQFSIKPDGTLNAQGTTGTPSANPVEITRHPAVDTMYTTHNNSTDEIITYTQSPANGALANTNTQNTPPGPNGVVIHPNGGILYTAYQTDNNLEWYTLNGAGVPTPRGFSPGGGGSEPFGIVVHPGGQWVYFSLQGLNQIRRFDINLTNGDLSNATNVTTLAAPNTMAINQAGTLLLVACATANSVQTFAINQSTGVLTPADTIAAGNGTTGIAIDSTGNFVYTANSGDDSISIYAVDAATGALTSAGTVAAGDGANRIIIVSQAE